VKVRVIFDSNVYVAAAINPGGYARAWLHGAAKESRSYDLYASEAILDEVTMVLERMGAKPDTIASLVAQIRAVNTLVKPTKPATVVRDAADNMIIECAVAADAHMIISADKDLTQLRRSRDIAIYPTSYLKYAFPQDFTDLGH
jgi:uncharacterized protein